MRHCSESRKNVWSVLVMEGCEEEMNGRLADSKSDKIARFLHKLGPQGGQWPFELTRPKLNFKDRLFCGNQSWPLMAGIKDGRSCVAPERICWQPSFFTVFPGTTADSFWHWTIQRPQTWLSILCLQTGDYIWLRPIYCVKESSKGHGKKNLIEFLRDTPEELNKYQKSLIFSASFNFRSYRFKVKCSLDRLIDCSWNKKLSFIRR